MDIFLLLLMKTRLELPQYSVPNNFVEAVEQLDVLSNIYNLSISQVIKKWSYLFLGFCD